MGFTLQDFNDRAEAKYKGLVLDDGPNGPITLRSAIRLSDGEADKLDAQQKDLTAYQDSDGETKPSILRTKMLATLATLADKPADLRKYLAHADLAVIAEIYTAYNEQTQAAEGN